MISLDSIPSQPGCYIFRDECKNIIYIGKAKNLKKRVKSYFQKKDLAEKTRMLVKQIADVEFIATDNEVEALILENNLIKKNLPKYNINLKDSKRYAYIQLTDEKFPRLLVARSSSGGGEFFGPFVLGATRDYVLSFLTKAFRIRTCRRFPKKACLRYHIRLCDAPCIEKVSEDKYNSNVDRVRMILKGRTSDIAKLLRDEMKTASDRLDFERALELKNQAEAIDYLNERQNMELSRKYDEDIVNFVVKGERVYLMLFNIHRGMLENKQEFEFLLNDNFFEEFLLQYYSENPVPKELIVPLAVPDSLLSFLEMRRGKKVRVIIPKIGAKKQLLDLALKNIDLSFFGEIGKLEDLKNKLKLQEIPVVIECFDVSHLSGTSMVASMVQFRSGKPDKGNYRRFKIRTVEGVDDFRAIAEAVRRRYSRLLRENASLPNLAIIDGGKGQLNFALEELKNLGLKLPVISIAKKLEEIYVPGLEFPIVLNRKSDALKLVRQIRDEAHRFAISYNRLLRKKELFEK